MLQLIYDVAGYQVPIAVVMSSILLDIMGSCCFFLRLLFNHEDGVISFSDISDDFCPGYTTFVSDNIIHSDA
jgi:hypothetical protein